MKFIFWTIKLVIEMKNFLKIFSLAIFAVMSMTESVFANPYPATLDNGNLVCVDGGMGVGRYADRLSVQVQRYAPPNYQLSIKIFSVTFSEEYFRNHDTYVGGPYKIGDSFELSFKYNWDRKIISYQRGNNWLDWDINHDYSHAEGNPLIPHAAEVAFVSAYNMRFFDNKTSSNGQRVISEDFYRTLNI